jgi:hypothetical protein
MRKPDRFFRFSASSRLQIALALRGPEWAWIAEGFPMPRAMPQRGRWCGTERQDLHPSPLANRF